MSAITGIARFSVAQRTRRHPLLQPGVLIPGAVVLTLLVAVVAPGLLTSYDPATGDTQAVFQPPTAEHPFGTDQLGRDVFARTVYGAGISLGIGLGATLIAIVLGTLIGALAALGPRGIDRVVVRLIDIFLAFPELLLALLVIAVLGRGPINVLLAVGISAAAGYARLIRAQLLQVRLHGYVEHARALGEPPWRILGEHIVPNAIRPLVVLATIGVGTSILSASSLSFLGLGVVPPTPEWGALLADGRSYLSVAPWASLFPATVVAVSVISITLLGRKLQSHLAKGGTS